MTAIISWSTTSGHGVGSLYLASDSRKSFLCGNGDLVFGSDDLQKTFAAPTTADIFAVCGRVDNLSKLIPQLFLAAVNDRDTIGGTAVADEYTHRLMKNIEKISLYDGLILFHGFRFGVNDFGLNRVAFGKSTKITKIQIQPANGLLYRDGSGQEMVKRAQLNDPETDAKGFSRWYWQSFVISLSPSSDTGCGGSPQLVGLFQKGPGVTFGVRFKGESFVNGTLAEGDGIAQVRDELFQRVSTSGILLDKAQKHARNYPGRRLF